MLRLDDLTKRFGDLTAVDHVSFEVRPGETFGLLGPNGAGKTTLMHMIIGVLDPDEGCSTFGGDDTRLPATRSNLGIAPQALALYDDLSADENLRFFGALYGLSGVDLRERIDWALDFAGLRDRRRSLVKTFSGGMKRRLNLVAALVHRPRLVLLDEPTVGVDPQSRLHLFECIEQLRREEVTILYTTHYMEEAQRLCDRIAIVDKGSLLAIDTVDALLDEHGGQSVVEATVREIGEADLPGRLEGDRLRVETDNPFETVNVIAGTGVELDSLTIRRPDLESVFLALTGRSLRDD